MLLQKNLFADPEEIRIQALELKALLHNVVSLRYWEKYCVTVLRNIEIQGCQSMSSLLSAACCWNWVNSAKLL